MPKRTAAEKIEYYSAKIKKLRSEKRQKRRVIIYSSDSDENLEPESQTPLSPTLPLPGQSRRQRKPPPSPTPSLSPPTPPPCVPPNVVLPSQDIAEINDPEVDPQLLEALGDATEDVPVYGPEINKNLAQRWLPILKKGLQTDIKEKLLKDQIVPDNCRLLRAPSLNPEIAAAVTDSVSGRDKKLQTKQDQLGLGITAVNRAMSLLLTGDDKLQAVKILSDGCRILTDLHFTETELRKKLITPVLEKSFLTVIKDQIRDESLFGSTLSEKIKASKTIERNGLQIKKYVNSKTSSASNNPSTSTSTRYQGNWSGPPRFQQSNRGGRASYKGQGRRAPLAAPPRSTRPLTSTSSSNKRARQSIRK